MSGDLIVQAARRLGLTILPDNDQWEYRMEVKSETSDRLYVVSRNKASQKWGCSCPGWRRYRTCKHLDAMVPALIAPPSATPRIGRR